MKRLTSLWTARAATMNQLVDQIAVEEGVSPPDEDCRLRAEEAYDDWAGRGMAGETLVPATDVERLLARLFEIDLLILDLHVALGWTPAVEPTAGVLARAANRPGLAANPG